MVQTCPAAPVVLLVQFCRRFCAGAVSLDLGLIGPLYLICVHSAAVYLATTGGCASESIIFSSGVSKLLQLDLGPIDGPLAEPLPFAQGPHPNDGPPQSSRPLEHRMLV